MLITKSYKKIKHHPVNNAAIHSLHRLHTFVMVYIPFTSFYFSPRTNRTFCPAGLFKESHSFSCGCAITTEMALLAHRL